MEVNMGLGIAITLVGFGGQRSQLYKETCGKVAYWVGKHTSYPVLSFVQIEGELFTVKEAVVSAAKKMIALPSLSGITAKWEVILRELSADCEETLVTVNVDGIEQAAINGNIL
jgi:hypothetical protein